MVGYEKYYINFGMKGSNIYCLNFGILSEFISPTMIFPTLYIFRTYKVWTRSQSLIYFPFISIQSMFRLNPMTFLLLFCSMTCLVHAHSTLIMLTLV